MTAPCNGCGSSEWEPLFAENGFRLGVCTDCRLHYLDNPPTVEQRMTEMESGHFAGTHNVIEASKQAASENALVTQFRQYVERAREIVPTGRWLDVGCGAGLLLHLAQEAGYEVEGVELTKDRREATAAAGFKVHGQPIEDLAFGDEEFDVISLINVFSHLTDPAGTLAELRRILKPEGVAIVATGELGSGVERSHLARWNLGDHLYFLGDGTMKQLAEAAGLKVARVDRAWLPDEMYSRAWLRTSGLSKRRDLMKKLIDKTPGAYPAYRRLMLQRSRGNPIHSTVYLLAPH